MPAQLQNDYVGASKFSALLSVVLHRVPDTTSRGLPKHRPDFPAFRIANRVYVLLTVTLNKRLHLPSKIPQLSCSDSAPLYGMIIS